MPVSGPIVLDSSAVLAWLELEKGAEVVAGILTSAPASLAIHSINACEVYYHFARKADRAIADSLASVFVSAAIEVDETMTAALWRHAGDIKAEWRRVSLADCFALALAAARNATLITCDRHEMERLVDAGICPIHFIR